MTKQNIIRFFDMFSGIGGFRAGLERAGGFTCIGHCEIDKHAEKAYRAIHNVKENEVYYEDARTIKADTMPDFGLLCGGFPCQSFSLAGKRKGFDDARGTLFFEIARVAREKRPPYLLLENVPGLLSHDKGRTFTAILNTLSELRYHVEFQVLNSKDFGVPQSRRRVYIVGYLDSRCAGKILPFCGTNPETLKLLINGRQDSRVYDPAGVSKTLLAKSGGAGGRTGLYAVGYNRKNGITKKLDTAYTLTAGDFRGLDRSHTQNAVLETDGEMSACAVLTPEKEKVRQNGRRIKNKEEPMFTLTSQDRHGGVFLSARHIASGRRNKAVGAGRAGDNQRQRALSARGQAQGAVFRTWLCLARYRHGRFADGGLGICRGYPKEAEPAYSVARGGCIPVRVYRCPAAAEPCRRTQIDRLRSLSAQACQ